MQFHDMTLVHVGTILVDLQEILENSILFESIKLSRVTLINQLDKNTLDPKINALGVRELALPSILHPLGIRSLTLQGNYNQNRLTSLEVAIPNVEQEQYPWRYLQKNEIISELQLLFKSSRTIAFDDWSRLAGASDLWNGLLRDVIKPTGKQNLEFIFYLGDPMSKFYFQVVEALDIIRGFSLYGRATLALDQGEAIRLWMVLNRVNLTTPLPNQSFSDLKNKYFSIFRTLNIKTLLIYSGSNALVFSANEQFVLPRKLVEQTVGISKDDRQNFIEGFSMGLLLHLDIVQCIALGLVILGSYRELQSPPEQKDLLAYIDQWIEDLL